MNHLTKEEIIFSHRPRVIDKSYKEGRLLKFITLFLITLISFLLFSFFIKGDQGVPLAYQTGKDKTVGGPFEVTNSTSRYALTEAIVENKTFLFTDEQAAFSLPDIKKIDDKKISVFMPGISFIGIPFYLFGKQFGMPQLFSYFSVALFAFINMFLIARISYKLGANLYASLFAGFMFLFGTNALAYAFSYTQHHTSLTFLLLSLLIAMGKKSIYKNILFGIFVGVSFLLDVPNLIFLLPVGIYLLLKHIDLKATREKFKLSLHVTIFTILLGIVPFLATSVFYNLHTTGSPFLIAQSIDSESGNPDPFQPHYIFPYNPTDQINGLYVLLLSPDRSWLFYSPFVWLGIFGLLFLFNKRSGFVRVLIAIVLLNITSYSMFLDPWGGWAFGARYLFPSAAIFCIGLGVALSLYRKKLWFVIPLAITGCYSLMISILGALTSMLIPYSSEAHMLHVPIKYAYTPLYNLYLLTHNTVGSLFYNLAFPTMSGVIYGCGLLFVSIVIAVSLYLLSLHGGNNLKKKL